MVPRGKRVTAMDGDAGGGIGIGYHVAAIPRGEWGEASKVAEEAAEFMDAVAQGARIMELVELSDLFGAMEGYLARHHPGMAMVDLAAMSAITGRAFGSGHRD